MNKVTKNEYAIARVEELLPLVDDHIPANDKNAVELSVISDIVIAYENEHSPIGKPAVSELIDSLLHHQKRYAMKRMYLTTFLFSFFILVAFPQEVDFLKRVEHNILMLLVPEEGEGVPLKRFEYRIRHGMLAEYNLKSKENEEKLLLGDFNAPVEFFFKPSLENDPPSSLRIFKNTFWYLEVKYISNFKEVKREMYNKYPTISAGGGGFWTSSKTISDKKRKKTDDHNEAARAKRTEENLHLFKVDTLLLPISNQFAEQLYEKMVTLIVNYKAKGIPATVLDGYSVSFRAVIDDEVWSLWIRHPTRKNALQMSDLCRKIITDAMTQKLDEQKYISVLKTFENNQK